MCSLCPISRPLMLVACLIWLDITSIQSVNSKEETGHPCLTPLYRENSSEKNPLFFTHAQGLVYNNFIQCWKFGPKLNFSSTLNKKLHSTQSKAFLKSTNISRNAICSYSPMTKISPKHVYIILHADIYCNKRSVHKHTGCRKCG